MSQSPQRRRTEHEAKLQPSPEFELSGLDGAVKGTTLRVLPLLELEATYLDTPALTLARSGITVRHRTGDGEERWTLKLPSGADDRSLIRQELDILGPKSPRPRELASTLTVHLRGRRLVPVAVISTIRARVVLDDPAGVPLVEVAHDLVTVTQGRRLIGSWEEVEVEALDPVAGAAALARTVRALRAIGCKRAKPTPKLVRALGDEAAAPPEVVVGSLPRHPSTADVLGHALARSIHQILDFDPKVRIGGEAEDLHQFRVAVRRLRSDLRTFRHFLDAEQAGHLIDELRWVADDTNESRDLDVLCDWLDGRRHRLGDSDQGEVDALLALVRDQQDLSRARYLRTLGSARYVTLVHDLVTLAENPPRVRKRDDERAGRRLARQVDRRWKDLNAAVADLEANPGDAALHRARIATKKCRAAAEAIAPLEGAKGRRFARALAHLQDALGAAHDASVFESWLRRDGATVSAFVAGELTVIARSEAADQQARWPQAWSKVRRSHPA